MKKRSGIVLGVVTLTSALAAGAQEAREASPSAALASALVAACRQNEAQFARYQTAENAEAFKALPQAQRIELMKRMMQLPEAGRPLLSTGEQGRTVIRCETRSTTGELRFGPERVRENIAFVPVEATGGRPIEFGMVREGGGWRMLSVGLLLLSIPELAKQWGTPPAPAEESEANEAAAIVTLQRLAAAIETYKKAFGKWPERLEQLRPAPRGSVSPEQANLVEKELAAGSTGGYRFQYRMVTPKVKPAEAKESSTQSKETGEPSYEVTATPVEYGKTGRRSFYLDASGQMRGADKQGAEATTEDPKIERRG